MNLRVLALGLVLAAAPLSAAPVAEEGYVYGDNHCYAFNAPASWRMDKHLLAQHGVGMAFLPDQSHLRGVLIYTRSAERAADTFEEAVQRQVGEVLTMYAVGGMRVQAEKLRPFTSRNGVQGEWWRFYGYPNGGEERAVYFPGRQNTLNFFVAQIPRLQQAAEADAALAALAASYRERSDCRPCATTGACAASE